MTTPTKEMTPEEVNKLEMKATRGEYITKAEQLALIAQARASLPTAPVPAVPAQIADDVLDLFPLYSGDGEAMNEEARKLDRLAAASVPALNLNDIEQYRMQMAAIGTAAFGYWTEAEGILPEYDTVPLRDVAKLYAKYATLHAAANPVVSVPAQQIGGSIDTPEFRALIDAHHDEASSYQAEYRDNKEFPEWEAIIAHVATKVQAAKDEAIQWVSVDERLPEVGRLVIVYRPATAYDHPEDIRISFDCIDPNDDDHASWQGHNEYYEHFCCVAKPEGSTGPSEKAPYTHWMPIPRSPAATDAGEQQ